ncbi:MAG TPA: uroporphyrinogen decarboxylase [Coriobacteriia bacterium]|nr:uroporphyrinogen decarboxylase [Coriobacteriia bacterium]
MLTKRQNFIETITGGNPDRFVNQYEAFALDFAVDPLRSLSSRPVPDVPYKDSWGVTQVLHGPGVMPIHDEELIVLKDILEWRDAVKAPSLDIPESAWEGLGRFAEEVDREEQFFTMATLPGLLERFHHLMGMEGAMVALALEPEESQALVNFIVDWEIEYAAMKIARVAPEVLFRHDDWGSSHSTLISPAMFEEIFLPPYKRLYGWYKDNGIKYIVHHSDSYAATLVPYMIEMGIDVWQGVMSTNDTPELIRQYGGQISFMGDIDNLIVDKVDWSPEVIREQVEKSCRSCGKHYYIPSSLMGLPSSMFPGVYEAVSAEINRMSAMMFA